MHGDYGWGMGFGFGWLFMLLFWILVILGIVFLIKILAGGLKSDRREESALEILKKRYAKGEINKEEFEEKKKELL
jgi:putative membrane protein